MAICSPPRFQVTPLLDTCRGCSAMAGSAPSTQSGHRRKLHKRPASNHLPGDADQVKKGPWRVGANLLTSDRASPEMQHRAARTIEAAWSCILHTQPSSGGVGAFGPARHLPFLAQSKVRGKLLWTGRLRAFQRRLHQTRIVSPHCGAPLAHHALKVLLRPKPGPKEWTRRIEQEKICH